MSEMTIVNLQCPDCHTALTYNYEKSQWDCSKCKGWFKFITDNTSLTNKIASLQRELEQTKEERQKLVNYVNKLSSPGEHSLFETIDNTIVKLAEAEAKCQRMRNVIQTLRPHIEPCGCLTCAMYENTTRFILSEPPSISLDLYHKERNKQELGEVAIAVALARRRAKRDIESLGAAAGYVDKRKLKLLTAANDILKRLTE